MRSIRKIQDVVDWGLCIGCGACYALCDRGGVKLVNRLSHGIRPVFEAACADCAKCLDICPGVQVQSDLGLGLLRPPAAPDLLTGPGLEVWEGHAKD